MGDRRPSTMSPMQPVVPFRSPLSFALVALGLVACGGGSTGPDGVASVRFASTDTLFLIQGASAQLDAASHSASGARTSDAVVYSVPSGCSVTVSASGAL